MIMQTDLILVPGTILYPGQHKFESFSVEENSNYPAQPLYIIREATKEEWVNEGKQLEHKMLDPIFPYFYEVSTD